MSTRLRKLHVDIDPAVEVEVGARRVRFVGLNLIHRVVMVEYDVDPPMRVRDVRPRLLDIEVRDDVRDEPYEPSRPDFDWDRGGLTLPPDRTTTRLKPRPPATATRLDFVIWPADSRLAPVARFSVGLPVGHGEPWPSV